MTYSFMMLILKLFIKEKMLHWQSSHHYRVVFAYLVLGLLLYTTLVLQSEATPHPHL
jgi:hypothetical protein